MRENSRWLDSLPWMKMMVWGGVVAGLVSCEGERRVYANTTGLVWSSLGEEVMLTVLYLSETTVSKSEDRSIVLIVALFHGVTIVNNRTGHNKLKCLANRTEGFVRADEQIKKQVSTPDFRTRPKPEPFLILHSSLSSIKLLHQFLT